MIAYGRLALDPLAGRNPSVPPPATLVLGQMGDAALVASLDAGATHVWRLALDEIVPAAWDRYLTLADRRRVASLVRQVDRNRRLHARCCLRALLARYIAEPGSMLDLSPDANGKPSLAPHYKLHFNLSHTDGHGVVAISRRPVGVDIERFYAPTDLAQLAGQVFTAREMTTFERLPATVLANAFITCWTRKEACLKALGTGLLTDPRNIDVGITPAAALVVWESTILAVRTLDGGADHALALAVARSGGEDDDAPAMPVLEASFTPLSGTRLC